MIERVVGPSALVHEATWAHVASVRPVLLDHVRTVSSISSLESGRLAIFFKDRRWHSDSSSMLIESRMAIMLWKVAEEGINDHSGVQSEDSRAAGSSPA